MRFLFLAVALGLGGCYVRMYEGPSRPVEQISRVECDGIEIAAVDGVRADHDKVALAPGTHALAVRLNDEKMYAGLRAYSRGAQVVCLPTRPGHIYQVRPVYQGGRWRAEVIDETLTEMAKSWMMVSEADGCSITRRPITQ